MKFFKQHLNRETLFGVYITESEIYNRDVSSVALLRLQNVILSRFANMIAAYHFKKHKEELDVWLSSEDCKMMVAKELASRLDVKIKS